MSRNCTNLELLVDCLFFVAELLDNLCARVCMYELTVALYSVSFRRSLAAEGPKWFLRMCEILHVVHHVRRAQRTKQVQKTQEDVFFDLELISLFGNALRRRSFAVR